MSQQQTWKLTSVAYEPTGIVFPSLLRAIKGFANVKYFISRAEEKVCGTRKFIRRGCALPDALYASYTPLAAFCNNFYEPSDAKFALYS